MSRGVGVDGSNVVMLFGARRSTEAEEVSPPHTGMNDNEPTEPVKTVTVRRRLENSGIIVKVKVPVDEYFGVAVSTRISDDGVLSSAIELCHEDPELNYRVFEEDGNSNVVAEWQNWGKKLRLPLYIIAGDGSLLPYSQLVDGVSLGNITARRKLAAEANRRPRFLFRRKPGEAN